MSNFSQFLSEASAVLPSKRQLGWFDTEFYAFVHFSPNTYTGLEWGTGSENPEIFNPTELDCDEWVETIKSAGMKGMILTAKHHDGFCLWPSKYTEHSIKNSPFKNGSGDIVREAADACRKGGIKFGFYLSPWDRHSQLYGTDAYNDYYKAQLTELLTEYGDIFCVWLDGACGEGPNGRKQQYDFPGYIELIRHYQPDAVIFNAFGPDVRWCGNESGKSRYAEWAVVPGELCPFAKVQTSSGPMEGSLQGIYNTDSDIGSMSNIIYSKGLCFCGSEVDMSIRPGWFYHPDEKPHSLERLFNTYITSVGGNACFNLNIPPMPNGRFAPEDVQRLGELGDALKHAFGREISQKGLPQRTAESSASTQCTFTYSLAENETVNYVVLMEDIAGQGQRIESFKIQIPDGFGGWCTAFDGTTIGHKRIVKLEKPVCTEYMRIVVTSARNTVENLTLKLY